MAWQKVVMSMPMVEVLNGSFKLNSLFLLYLPYYLDFAEYTGNRRILMPSFFHDMMYFFYRFIGNYQLINDSIKLEADKNKNTFISWTS